LGFDIEKIGLICRMKKMESFGKTEAAFSLLLLVSTAAYYYVAT